MRTSLVVSIVASMVVFSAGTCAQASIRLTTAIPPQPLTSALRSLVTQRDMQIVYSSELLADRRTEGAAGELTMNEALTQLLNGTGLTYRFVDEKTVSIVPVTAGASQDRGAARGERDAAGALTSWEDEQQGSTAPSASNGFWGRLRVAQAEEQKASGDTDAGAAESAGGNAKLEEIVVTAQRRKETLQDVPISITVLSGEELDSATTPGIVDALRSVPGFDARGEGITSTFSFRGVSSGAGPGPVAFYLDSVPYGFIRESFYPNPTMYDLDRVEVLVGPQGTLYGANALNGVVRILTNDANADEFELKARTLVSMTEDGDQNTGGDLAVNVPIVEGRLGARFVAGFNNLGGWVDSPTQSDVNDAETVDYRLKLHGEVTDTLTIDFSVWREEREYSASDYSFDDRTTTIVRPEPGNQEFTTYGLSVRKELPHLSVSSQTSSIDYRHDAIADGLALNFNALLFAEYTAKVFSQEFNAVSNLDGPWQWSAGVFYREAEDSAFSDLTLPAIPLTLTNNDFSDLSESYAVYGEVSRDFADLNLAVGLRYFHDEETMTTNMAYGGPSPIPADESFTATSEAVTPRAVLTWTPRDDIMAYASYSQGFRSGFAQGPNVQSQFPNFDGVDPDRLTNYEIGAKESAYGGRVTYEAAVFYIDWQDAQQNLNVLLPNGLTAQAAVNSEAISGIGASFAITAEPIEGLQLGLNGSWNDLAFDADVKQADGTLLFAKGDRPNLSPEYTAGATIEYSWALGGYRAITSLAGTYKSPQNTTTLSAGSVEADPILIADARLSLQAPKNWTLTLFSDNITDEDGHIWEFTFAPVWVTRPLPRTVGLQLEYNFGRQ